jgi:hemoglobin
MLRHSLPARTRPSEQSGWRESAAHEPSHARTPFRPEHYDRWLDLFIATVDDRFEGPVAEAAKARARRMARALQRLLDGTSAAGDAPIEVRMTTGRDTA